MVLHPEVQAKARRELDSIIGNGRMPSWEDRPNLPYIRAVVEETIRCALLPSTVAWMIAKSVPGAPSPLTAAAPHSVTKDDIYNGMLIPKRALILVNASPNHSLKLPDKANRGQ